MEWFTGTPLKKGRYLVCDTDGLIRVANFMGMRRPHLSDILLSQEGPLIPDWQGAMDHPDQESVEILQRNNSPEYWTDLPQAPQISDEMKEKSIEKHLAVLKKVAERLGIDTDFLL